MNLFIFVWSKVVSRRLYRSELSVRRVLCDLLPGHSHCCTTNEHQQSDDHHIHMGNNFDPDSWGSYVYSSEEAIGNERFQISLIDTTSTVGGTNIISITNDGISMDRSGVNDEQFHVSSSDLHNVSAASERNDASVELANISTSPGLKEEILSHLKRRTNRY